MQYGIVKPSSRGWNAAATSSAGLGCAGQGNAFLQFYVGHPMSGKMAATDSLLGMPNRRRSEMRKLALLSMIVALAGCQATSEANIDPQLQPAFRSDIKTPGASPYLQWQRGF